MPATQTGREDKALLRMQAEVLAALGNPIRLAVVQFLADGEQCVCDIAEHVGAERSNVSRHLAVLHRAGIVDLRKDGLRMIYSLRTPCILDSLGCVRKVLRDQLRERRELLRKL